MEWVQKKKHEFMDKDHVQAKIDEYGMDAAIVDAVVV